MAGTGPKNIVKSAALNSKQLQNMLENEIKKISKKYRTNLYGFEFGEVAEKQRQDMLPSMETHCARIHCTQNCTCSLDI